MCIKQELSKNFNKVLGRKIQGYAFLPYPNKGGATPAEYRLNALREIEADLSNLNESQLTEKYAMFL